MQVIGIRVPVPGAVVRWTSMTCAIALTLLQSALAAAAGAPTVLTLQRGAETLELTLEELAALPQHTLVTTNEFTDTPVAYTGPLARDVLELLALDSLDIVRFTAANDYYIDVPTDELHRYDVVLAMEADGRKLSRRDKGPLWLMYPLSEHPELAGPVYNARLIWQVVRVDAL
jgi:hypothetical protein